MTKGPIDLVHQVARILDDLARKLDIEYLHRAASKIGLGNLLQRALDEAES